MSEQLYKSNSSTQLEQDLEQSRPRHPYAFCQCIGEDCIECLRERIDVLEQALEEKEKSLQTTQIIARMALRENQEHREEKLGLPYLANIPVNVGVAIRESAPSN